MEYCISRAKKELDTHLVVVEEWDMFCVEIDKKKVLLICRYRLHTH